MTGRRPFAAEDGFTLVELLVALFIGTLVLLATFNIFDAGQRAAFSHQNRSDAVQQGRNAMEQLTQELHSQVCLGQDPNTGLSIPAVISGDDNSITFYADMNADTGTGFVPQKRQIVFTPQGQVWEYTWYGSGTAPNTTYKINPDRSRMLLSNVQHVVSNGNPVPYLQYFGFTGTSPITPSLAFSTPLSTGANGDAAHVVQIGVNFAVPVKGVGNSPPVGAQTVPFQSYTYVRTADPNDPTHSPECL